MIWPVLKVYYESADDHANGLVGQHYIIEIQNIIVRGRHHSFKPTEAINKFTVDPSKSEILKMFSDSPFGREDVDDGENQWFVVDHDFSHGHDAEEMLEAENKLLTLLGEDAEAWQRIDARFEAMYN